VPLGIGVKASGKRIKPIVIIMVTTGKAVLTNHVIARFAFRQNSVLDCFAKKARNDE